MRVYIYQLNSWLGQDLDDNTCNMIIIEALILFTNSWVVCSVVPEPRQVCWAYLFLCTDPESSCCPYSGLEVE